MGIQIEILKRDLIQRCLLCENVHLRSNYRYIKGIELCGRCYYGLFLLKSKDVWILK